MRFVQNTTFLFYIFGIFAGFVKWRGFVGLVILDLLVLLCEVGAAWPMRLFLVGIGVAY